MLTVEVLQPLRLSLQNPATLAWREHAQRLFDPLPDHGDEVLVVVVNDIFEQPDYGPAQAFVVPTSAFVVSTCACVVSTSGFVVPTAAFVVHPKPL